MEPTRRRFLAGAGAAAVAGLAACAGRSTLEGAAFAAACATVPGRPAGDRLHPPPHRRDDGHPAVRAVRGRSDRDERLRRVRPGHRVESARTAGLGGGVRGALDAAGGRPAPVTRFDADARPLAVGREVDVYFYVSGSVELGDEYVVALTVHPRALGRRAATVERQMAGVVAT